MIFVTVGTTYFDELVREVDRLAQEGLITGDVVAQIGFGEYLPKHIEWVRYLDDIRPYYNRADLVICHGGVGTVFELMLAGKPFIAVANRALPGDHQADLLQALETGGCCTVCYDVTDLGQVMRQEDGRAAYQSRPVLPSRIWGDLLADRASCRLTPTTVLGGVDAIKHRP